MPLVTLKTNLKSLAYGHDRIYGASSKQPYIVDAIPEKETNPDFTSYNNDYILRGGILAARDSAVDVLRLGKMFVDTTSPSGIFFTTKQQLLSRTAVRTQASIGPLNEGIYTPLSTLAEAGLVAFGGHLNKQGLNPFAGIRNPFLGAGSSQFFDGSYLQALKNSTNPTSEYANKYDRLVQLFGIKMIPGRSSQFAAYPYASQNIINSGEPNILKYKGGPGSILGIGNTTIKFALNNSGAPLRTIYDNEKLNPGNGTVSYMTTNAAGFIVRSDVNTGNNTVFARAYSFDNNTRNTAAYTPFIGRDFRAGLINILDANNNPETTILSRSPNYSTLNIEARLNYGGKNNFGPGNKQGKNLISYNSGSGIGPIDKLNALALYRSENVELNSPDYPTNDLVKFRIASIDNNNPAFKTFMHFRAFINSFSDSYNGQWNPITYLGRGENFYTYSNFTRTISLSWTVAAQSKEELIPMYKKLNYLASNVAPDYTSNGYMTGNLVQLTIGGYLYEQVGFITSLTYDIPEDSPWEIGITDDGNNDPSVKELPHRINVSSFSFTPIHDFIPAKQELDFDNGDTGKVAAYGAERFIALANGSDQVYNNYDVARQTYE
jgi:hypothetical protein